jgi:hypothetical protein
LRTPAGVGLGIVLAIFRNDDKAEKQLAVYKKVKVEWDGTFRLKITDEAEQIELKTIKSY